TTRQLAGVALNGPGRAPFTEFQTRLTALEAARERIEAAISHRSAEFRARTQPVTLEAVAAAIPVDAALIEFALYDPFEPRARIEAELHAPARYVAYVLDHHGTIWWKDVGPADEIDTVVAAFREALRDPLRSDVNAVARAVDERIMRPLRPIVGQRSRLLISPDGSLNLIPFETHVDEDGRFAIERYGISYLTTGRDLLRLQVTRH